MASSQAAAAAATAATTVGWNLRAGRSGSSTDAKSDEKGGGRDEDEASATGYCGGGGECSATSWSAATDASLLAAALSRAAVAAWRCSRCNNVSTDSGDAEGPVPASCDADNAADYRWLWGWEADGCDSPRKMRRAKKARSGWARRCSFGDARNKETKSRSFRQRTRAESNRHRGAASEQVLSILRGWHKRVAVLAIEWMSVWAGKGGLLDR